MPGSTGAQSVAPDEAAATPPAGTDASSVQDSGTATAPGSDPQDQAAPAPLVDEGSPDALGEVEEQELLPEDQSTIANPGEALDALLPALEVTGHDGVDDALATLDDMAEKSVHEHVEVFDAVHEELRRTLDQAADR